MIRIQVVSVLKTGILPSCSSFSTVYHSALQQMMVSDRTDEKMATLNTSLELSAQGTTNMKATFKNLHNNEETEPIFPTL